MRGAAEDKGIGRNEGAVVAVFLRTGQSRCNVVVGAEITASGPSVASEFRPPSLMMKKSW